MTNARFKSFAIVSVLASVATLFLWYRFAKPPENLVATSESMPQVDKLEQKTTFDFNSEDMNAKVEKKSREQIDPGTFYQESEDKGEEKEGDEEKEEISKGEEDVDGAGDVEEKVDAEENEGVAETKEENTPNKASEKVEKEEKKDQENEETDNVEQSNGNIPNQGNISAKKVEPAIDVIENAVKNSENVEKTTANIIPENQNVENNPVKYEEVDQPKNDNQENVENAAQKKQLANFLEQNIEYDKHKGSLDKGNVKILGENAQGSQPVVEKNNNEQGSNEVKNLAGDEKPKKTENSLSAEANPSVNGAAKEESDAEKENIFVDYKEMDNLLGKGFNKVETTNKEKDAEKIANEPK